MATRKLSTRLPESRHGWRSTEDVIAALRALQNEPLPAIVPTSLDAPTVWRAFCAAYKEHPTYRAAMEWTAAVRTPHPDSNGRFTPWGLGSAINGVPFHAMQRYFAERRANTPAAPADDPPPF